jgi:hypothetical protein
MYESNRKYIQVFVRTERKILVGSHRWEDNVKMDSNWYVDPGS